MQEHWEGQCRSCDIWTLRGVRARAQKEQKSFHISRVAHFPPRIVERDHWLIVVRCRRPFELVLDPIELGRGANFDAVLSLLQRRLDVSCSKGMGASLNPPKLTA